MPGEKYGRANRARWLAQIVSTDRHSISIGVFQAG